MLQITVMRRDRRGFPLPAPRHAHRCDAVSLSQGCDSDTLVTHRPGSHAIVKSQLGAVMRAFLLHRSQLAYALQHFSRESLTGHEQQMESCAHGVLPRLSRLSLAALLLVAGCGIAAAEPEKAGCTGFCSPVAPRQLDGLRAQGLAHPAGDTAVSVILWDEYRRTRAAPGDVLPANAMAVPGGAALVNTASTIR